MSIAPAAVVAGAERTSRKYGLFSTFTFRPSGSDRWEAGVTWENDPCADLNGIGDPACPPTTTQGLPKTLTRNAGGMSEATPFTVYGHYTCSPVGNSPADAQDRALKQLLDREESRVEKAFATGDLGNTSNLQANAHQVHPIDLMDMATTLGALEEYLAEHYDGLGVVHASSLLAERLQSENLLIVKGSSLQTVLGNKVAVYATPQPPPHGHGTPAVGDAGSTTEWMYITPPIFGYRSEPFTSSNIPGDLLDKAKNDLYAVAERTYLLGFDPCGVAVTTVNLVAPATVGLSGG